MAKLIELLQTQYKRHYRSVVTFVVGLILALSYAVFVERVGNDDVYEASKTAISGEQIATTTEIVGLERSSPHSIRIPAIGLETEFEGSLGLNDDGSVEVPDSYEEVGWYKFGPTPGELGPAVVLGHVDSFDGPAIFYSLGELKAGDEIFIDRADGKTVTFRVTELERHEQDDFPTEKVYGNIDHPGLRLITCTGVYSHSSLRYSHNLIVFAEMVKE